MQHVREHGLRVPAVYDASGPDLVMERIEGVTMLDTMRRAPWSIARNASVLADLHRQLHAIPAPEWLAPSPVAGEDILHLDLHPLNVLMSDDGPVVIDWPNTRRGAAAADVAHTWLVLGTARPEARVDRAVAAVGRSVFLRRFLREFPREALLEVMPAVAVRWLADRNVTERERQATRRLLRRITDPRHVPVTYDNCAQTSGPFYHGTKSALEPGDELVPGYGSNYHQGRVSNNIYFSALVDTAAWGAELAAAFTGNEGRGRIYVVEPLGPFEDDPNVTDKKFPGNPTRSYRTRHPLRVVHELEDWKGHEPQVLREMLDRLAMLREQGLDVIED
jgi:rifampin ADP-ribosylating transferase